jgi:hypothetical protein
MAKECNLSYDDLCAAFDYDPQTGRLTWKIHAGRGIRPGDEAGSIKGVHTASRDGAIKQYRYITYRAQAMTAARVAWLLTYGEWPKYNILFADGDGLNLRLDNMRLGDYSSGDSNGNLPDRRMKPHVVALYGLQRNYDLSLEEYSRMLHAQNYVCAICEKPEIRTGNNGKPVALHVDHDHKTGRVRGLLCYKCNSALGGMEDSQDTFRAAIRYLDKHAEVPPFAPFSPEAA